MKEKSPLLLNYALHICSCAALGLESEVDFSSNGEQFLQGRTKTLKKIFLGGGGRRRKMDNDEKRNR